VNAIHVNIKVFRQH